MKIDFVNFSVFLQPGKRIIDDLHYLFLHPLLSLSEPFYFLLMSMKYEFHFSI